MKISRLLIIILTPVLLPQQISFAQSGNDAQLLRDLLVSCNYPCFMGIEVDVSSKVETANQLSTIGGAVHSFDGSLIEHSDDWLWHIGSQQFIDSQYPVWISFQDNVVRRIEVPLNVNLSLVIEAFGATNIIQKDPSNMADSSAYYLIYEEERLVFTVDTVYGVEKVIAVFLVSSVIPTNIIDDPIGVDVSQSCADYGTLPCVAPTATPSSTVLPTLTPTATPTDTPTLAAAPTSVPTCRLTAPATPATYTIAAGDTAKGEAPAGYAARISSCSLAADRWRRRQPVG